MDTKNSNDSDVFGLIHPLQVGSYVITLFIAGAIYILAGQSELFSAAVFSPHDAFYPVTPNIFNGILGLFNASTNYSKNFVAFYLHIPDKLFLQALLKLGLEYQGAQTTHTLICYFLLLTGSYYAFSRIFTSAPLLVLATLSYCFSPLMAIYYSTGIFYTLSTVVAFIAIPLFLMALLDISRRQNIWIIASSIFIFACNLMFLMPALLLLLGACIYQCRFLTTDWLRRFPFFVLGIVCISTIPVVLFLWLNASVPEVQSGMAGSTASEIQGGIFFPLMQISSWALYNDWHPRAILNFSEFMFSPGYKLLSILLILFLISYLLESKKYFLFFLLLLTAFFSKGGNFPFGDIYNFIVANIPFGNMIRSPDNKFGAFIPALIIIGLAQLSGPRRRTVAIILGLFLSLNVYGIYFNGALSAEKSGQKVTSYIRDNEFQVVVDLINRQENSVVLSPYENCSGSYSQGKFHTCNDLVLSNVVSQIIPKEFGSLENLMATYQPFTTVIYFNKHKTRYQNEFAIFRSSEFFHAFSPLYDSDNYSVFVRNRVSEECQGSSHFACVQKNAGYLYSIPLFYFDYLGGNSGRQMDHGLVQATEVLLIKPKPLESLLQLLYMLSWVANLFLMISFSKKGFTESLPSAV